MPQHGDRSRAVFGTDEIVISVGGERELIRALRAIERRQGSALARSYANKLNNASRAVVRYARTELRKVAPVYRKPGERSKALNRNTRRAYRGRYAGGYQPAGELRKSIKGRIARGVRRIEIGNETAFYVRPVLAGHPLPRGSGHARATPFVWDIREDIVTRSVNEYQDVLSSVARDFTRIWGLPNRF